MQGNIVNLDHSSPRHLVGNVLLVYHIFPTKRITCKSNKDMLRRSRHWGGFTRALRPDSKILLSNLPRWKQNWLEASKIETGVLPTLTSYWHKFASVDVMYDLNSPLSSKIESRSWPLGTKFGSLVGNPVNLSLHFCFEGDTPLLSILPNFHWRMQNKNLQGIAHLMGLDKV